MTVNESVFWKESLPKGWTSCKIGDICDVRGGKRLPKGHSYSKIKTNFPYLRVTDFKNKSITDTSLAYLKPETAKEISKYIISKDDLYISIAGSIGKIGIIPDFLDGAYLTENAAKLCEIEIIKSFFNLLLNSQYCQQQISKLIKYTSQPKLALFRIKEIIIIIPSLPEQKRIVTKIESIFTEIDAKQEEMKKLEVQLKSFPKSMETLKSSILKIAFEGNLVPQDPKDESGEVLGDIEKIESFFEKDDCMMLNQKDMKRGWKFGKISDICRTLQPGFAQGEKNVINGIIHLRMNNIGTNFKLNFDLTRTINATKTQFEKYMLQKDDIIFNNTNSPTLVGKSVIFHTSKICLYSNHLTRIRVDQSKIIPKWLLYSFQYCWYVKLFEKICNKWINQAAIKKVKLESIHIPIPPLNEQKRIVTKIESIFGKIDAIENMFCVVTHMMAMTILILVISITYNGYCTTKENIHNNNNRR